MTRLSVSLGRHQVSLLQVGNVEWGVDKCGESETWEGKPSIPLIPMQEEQRGGVYDTAATDMQE